MATPPHILLVEDDDNFRYLLEAWFHHTPALQDCVVTTVPTLEEAIEELASHQFLGVFMDLRLLDSPRLSTLKWLDDYAGDIPITAMSGSVDHEEKTAPLRIVDKNALCKPETLVTEVQHFRDAAMEAADE